MRNYNRRPSLRERIAMFMADRYGFDRLYYFLLAICFILIVINLFFNLYVLSILEVVIFIYAFSRVMSRNIYKRQQENEKFIRFIEKPKKLINLQKCKRRDRKTHVYKKCPSCKKQSSPTERKG